MKWLALLGAMSVSACAPNPLSRPIAVQRAPDTTWPMYQYDSSHNAVFSREHFRVAWITSLGGRVNGGLAVVGDRLFVDSFDNRLYALDVVSGHIVWSSRASNVLMSSPVIDSGRVIVGSGRDGFLRQSDWRSQIWGRSDGDDILAFRANDGGNVWRVHTLGEDMSSPVILDNSVTVANGDLHAYGISLKDGALRWRTSLPGVVTMASLTLDHGRVFISTCHNVPEHRETRAIDPRDGHVLWKNPNGSCDSSPAVDNGLVFVDGNDESVQSPFDPGGADIVTAIDEANGRTVWQHVSRPGPYSLVASGEHAIAGTAIAGVLYQSISNADAVVAFDGRSGRILWKVQTAAPVKMSPVVTTDRVVFGDVAGILYTVDRVSGRVLHTASFKDPFSTSPPVVLGQTLLISNGRYVIAVPVDVI